MIQLNFYLVFLTALVPLLVGFIWYNPKVFGSIWMRECGQTEEKLRSGSMPLIFSLVYVMGVLVSVVMIPIVIHQMGIFSMLQGVSDIENPESALSKTVADLLKVHGQNFRTFKHGALHGVLTALFLAMPVLVINGLFERRSWKYMLVHIGYWVVTLCLIGGIICAFA